MKGLAPLPEREQVVECWMGVDYPPQWALDAAAAGEPGSAWCPMIDPTLLDR